MLPLHSQCAPEVLILQWSTLGSERLEGCFLGSKYGRTLRENISSTSGQRRTECVRPP